MRKIAVLVLFGVLAVHGDIAAAPEIAPSALAKWSMKASIIEACSCPMFCQCYFNSKPAAHGGHEGHGEGEHFCRFNNAYRVDSGRWGDVVLDGAKFWLAGDLGGDFSAGQMNWAVLTFDPSVSKEQRDAISTILNKVYPVKWNSFTTGQDAAINWQASAARAEARLDGGKAAEIVLNQPESRGTTAEPVVIKNLKYWGVPRNDGFVLMPNELEAYRLGDKSFEFKGTNGFMITFDINSEDS